MHAACTGARCAHGRGLHGRGLRTGRGVHTGGVCTGGVCAQGGVCTRAGFARAGFAHTKNMWFMSVTRDVSQPEMSSLKLPIPPHPHAKSPLMSVTRETHQSAMAPYSAVAASASK